MTRARQPSKELHRLAGHPVGFEVPQGLLGGVGGRQAGARLSAGVETRPEGRCVRTARPRAGGGLVSVRRRRSVR